MIKDIGIIDYDMGNISSLSNAIIEVGGKPSIINDPTSVAGFSKIILPGVGAFKDAISNLRSKQFIGVLNDFASSGKQILGICLGMQLMCKNSSENGYFDGLGWFDAEVNKLPKASNIKLPHIGWNEVNFSKQNVLLETIEDKSDFYFVHGYHVECKNYEDILSTSSHGINFVSAIQNKNITGVQFHPEKSQSAGLSLIKNFLES